MLDIYGKVASLGKPNFWGSHIHLALYFNEWHAIIHSEPEKETLQFPQYGFPVGFEGPIPTPTMGNHPSATCYPQDVTAYISKVIGERTILGPRLLVQAHRQSS